MALDDELKKWEGALTDKQKLALEAVRFLGKAFHQTLLNIPEEVSAVHARLKSVADGAIEAVKDVTKCLAKVGASGDFADWYEITLGKDYCDGSDISIPGRVLSAAGLIVGSAKFWRLMGDAVGIAVQSKQVFKKTEAIIGDVKHIRSRMSNLGEVIPGTTIPKYFNIEVAGGSFHVHPNATKHMAEYIKSLPPSHGTPLRNDLILTSFQGAVSEAVASGAWKESLDSQNIIVVGGWELIFSQKAGDNLPVIKHALMK
jgi:hypothetical protein